MARQDEQERQQEYKLAGQREEYRNPRLSDRLEIVLYDNLAAYQRIYDEVNPGATVGNLYKGRVNSEQSAHHARGQFGYEPPDRGYGHTNPYTYLQRTHDSLMISGAIVESQDRLHALGHAEHYHDEEHCGAVDYAVGANGEVSGRRTAIVKQCLVDEHTFIRNGERPMA